MKISKLSVAATVTAMTGASILFGGPAQADRFRDDEWHIRTLKVLQANNISVGKGVIVAVIDTGVYPHVDLRDNLLSGTSLIQGGQKDGQSDPNGDGTKMASLIAAHGRNNQSGVIGIAPAAKILPIQISGAGGTGNSTKVGEAIEWATKHGADIVNFSGAVGPSFALQSAIEVADKEDVLVVAAVGNKSQDVVSAYPAAMPGVLGVGASDKSGQHAAVSVRSKNVQVCAPGVDIEGAKPPDRYSIGQGTSDSTAIVSGAAALVRAKFPALSAQEVIHRLTATATDIGKPGRDDECGYGVLNIVKALTADVPPLSGTATSTAPAPTESTAQPPTSIAADPDPDPKPAGSNTPAIIGGVVLVLLFGGLLTVLAIRRRKTR